MRSTLKVNTLVSVLLAVLVAGLILAAAQTAPQKSLPSVDKNDELRTAMEALSSSDDDKKIEAAYKLGEMHAQAVPAIPFLIERLLHESSGVGMFGRDKLKYVPDVKFVLTSGNKVGVVDPVQRVVAEALAKIGKPALKPLRETLSNKSPRTVHWAAVAIVKMNDPAATKVVTDLVGDEALQERHELVDALGYSKNLALVPTLITALKDKAEDVRSTAASALERMTGQEFGDDPGKWQKW
jgi:HEAT repeat protein